MPQPKAATKRRSQPRSGAKASAAKPVKAPKVKRHYCEAAPNSDVHRAYHASEYGFPMLRERDLFERLALEIMQAGLSWETILKKRALMVKAFDRFDARRVAAYGQGEIRRLLADPGIIRNRLKIAAIIENAARVLAFRPRYKGGFAGFLAAHHPLTKSGWVKLFKKTFLFTGGEITGEFLMSIGYLPGAHRTDCPVGRKIDALDPPWRQAERNGFRYEAHFRTS